MLVRILGAVALTVGVAGCSGASTEGDEGTRGAGRTEENPICTGESCCVPVVVDREAFRVYRVDDELYFDVFARTAGEPSVVSAYWSLTSEVNGETVAPLDCERLSNYALTDRAVAACRTQPRLMPECGETVRFEVRLASNLHDGLGNVLCVGVGYGPSTEVEAIVQCPVCPELLHANTPCEFPRASSCPYLTSDPYSMQPVTLSCACGGLWSGSGQRFWNCPVF